MFAFAIFFAFAVPAFAQLRITQPTRTTPIIGGGSVEIRWENTTATLSPTDSVRLEYSINGGVSWDFLATARGGSYFWRNIPTSPGQVLRVRVTQLGEKIPFAFPQTAPNIVLSGVGASSSCAGLAINTYPQAFWKPDGKQVAIVSASWDDAGSCALGGSATVAARVYDAETGMMLQRFSMRRNLTFDGTPYYSATGYGLDMLGTQQNFWSPDGRLFSWWQDETTLAVWNAATWTPLSTLTLPRFEGNVLSEYNTAWKPEGTSLLIYRLQSRIERDAMVRDALNPTTLDRSILEWQIGTSTPQTVVDGTNIGVGTFGCLSRIATSPATILRDLGNNVQFSNNRQFAAIGCGTGGVNVVNLQTRLTVQNLTRGDLGDLATSILSGTSTFYRNMAWSPNDELLAIWGGAGNNNDANLSNSCFCSVERVMILNVRTGVRKTLRFPFFAQYWTNVAWSADGRSLIVTADAFGLGLPLDDGEAAVIDVPPNGDVEQARVRLHLPNFNQRADGTQYGRWNNQERLWNPDGVRFAGGTATRLDIWDTQRGDLLQTAELPANLDLNRMLTWSPDGTKLLTTSRMRTNFAQDVSAMIIAVPLLSQAVSDTLSITPVPILSVLGSTRASYACETQAIVRLALTNRGLAELVVSSATLQFSTTANFPTLPALPSEFRLLRFPQRIAATRTDTVFIAFSSNRFATVSANLILRTNSGTSDIANILIEGRKDSTGIQLAQALIDLPDAKPNEFIALSPEFVNTGTVPISFPRREPLFQGSFAQIVEVVPNPVTPGNKGFLTLVIRTPLQIRERIVNEFRIPDACGRPTILTVSLGKAAVLVVPDTINLGSIVCGTPPNIRIPLRNTGNQTLLLNAFNVSQGNTDELFLLDAPRAVLPNTTEYMEFRFTPRSSGIKNFTIDLETNATNTPRKSVTVLLRKDTLDFRAPSTTTELTTDAENTTAQQTVRIVNFGTVPLRWQTPLSFGDKLSITAFDPPETPPNGGFSNATLVFRGGAAGFSFDTTITLRQTALNSTQPSVCELSRSMRVTVRVAEVPRLSAQIPALNLLCETTTLANIQLRNDGTGEVQIRDVLVVGQNTSEFRVEQRPQRLGRGQSGTVQLRFTPTSQGAKLASLEILSNARENPLVLTIPARKDSSGLAADRQTLDFGAVQVQTETRQTFSLLNTGSVPHQILLPIAVQSQGSEFVLESVQPNPIPANARAQATVRFLARGGGTFMQRIPLRDACGRDRGFDVAARAASGTLSLQASIDAVPAKEVELPVFLRNRSGSGVGTRFTIELMIANASLLEASESMPPSLSGVLNGARTLVYTAAISSDNENEPIIRIKLRGLLGNDSATMIRIPSLTVGGVPIIFASQAIPTVRVNMRGLNQIGGTRLFFANAPMIVVKNIFPNPATHDMTLDVEATAETPLRVRLRDVYGREHGAWSKTLLKGAQTLTLSTENIASGIYFVEMQYLCASEDNRMQDCRTVRQVVIVR